MQGVSSCSLGFYPNLKLALGLQRAFLLRFYRSQFWRLQKLLDIIKYLSFSFIGHNFGDYKNKVLYLQILSTVLSVIILETTKTPILDEKVDDLFYRSQFWRLQKHFGQEKDGSFRFYRSQFWRL